MVALLGVAGMFAEERRQRVRIEITAHIGRSAEIGDVDAGIGVAVDMRLTVLLDLVSSRARLYPSARRSSAACRSFPRRSGCCGS
jgi:hypothetical protein